MPTIRDDLADARSQLFRLSLRLRSIQIRQAARWAFDLPKFGNGAAERLVVSLILGVFFFFVVFATAHLIPATTPIRLAIASGGLLTTLLASAILVCWGTDDSLDHNGKKISSAVAELRVERNELAAEVAELDEIRAEKTARRDEQERRYQSRRERDRAAAPRPCPYCRESISPRAVKCPRCGEFLDERYRPQQQFSRGLAALLSWLIPGLGQICKGQVLAGLLWMALVYGLWMVSIGGIFCCFGGGVFVIPFAIIAHLICIFDAAVSSA